jgi:carboxypeptidase T
MSSRTLAILLSAAILMSAAPVRAGQAGDEPQFRVRIETANLDALRESLERSGYDVLGSDAARSTVDVAVSRAELYGLQSRGLSIVSVAPARPLRTAAATRATASGEDLTASAAAVSGGYLDLDGIVARLYEIAAAYPAIAQVVDVTDAYHTPATFEGRHIYALKISDNVAVDEDEPAMLIASTHHAREISTPVIALDAADRLTAGYERDPRITAAVDGNEIWIAPVWNPDGYNYVFTTNNLWRKNRRVFPTGVGVDQKLHPRMERTLLGQHQASGRRPTRARPLRPRPRPAP